MSAKIQVHPRQKTSLEQITRKYPTRTRTAVVRKLQKGGHAKHTSGHASKTDPVRQRAEDKQEIAGLEKVKRGAQSVLRGPHKSYNSSVQCMLALAREFVRRWGDAMRH